MSGTHKPAAGESRRAAPLDKETASDLRNEQELALQKQKAEHRRQRRFSKVAQMLGQESYITDWTHPCLYIEERDTQTSVSEFYPALNLAIDKFYHVDEFERGLTDLKKKALEKAGFKYAYLTPEIDLADIAKDLGVELKDDEE